MKVMMSFFLLVMFGFSAYGTELPRMTSSETAFEQVQEGFAYAKWTDPLTNTSYYYGDFRGPCDGSEGRDCKIAPNVCKNLSVNGQSRTLSNCQKKKHDSFLVPRPPKRYKMAQSAAAPLVVFIEPYAASLGGPGIYGEEVYKNGPPGPLRTRNLMTNEERSVDREERPTDRPVLADGSGLIDDGYSGAIFSPGGKYLILTFLRYYPRWYPDPSDAYILDRQYKKVVAVKVEVSSMKIIGWRQFDRAMKGSHGSADVSMEFIDQQTLLYSHSFGGDVTSIDVESF